MAEWAVAPEAKALIFVHGFKGSAVGTWTEFPSLLRQQAKCSGWDLVFYGYDGVRTRATNSANHLRTFLETLFTDALSIINPTLDDEAKRQPTFCYQKIILVAHSLGAIICRQALLDAHLTGSDWASRTGLILFAPAHRGAQILPLLTQTVTGLNKVLGVVIFALKYRWRVLRDLEPDSDTLNKLLQDTEGALSSGRAPYLCALQVVHGDADDVVEPIRFAQDPPHSAWPNVSHTRICKPMNSFLQPVSVVLAHL